MNYYVNSWYSAVCSLYIVAAVLIVVDSWAQVGLPK